MTGNITFVGHVSIDRVININGERTQPGGAALHAAFAAKTLMDDVILTSVIGENYPFKEFLDYFPKDYVKTSSLSSSRFVISYDEYWEAHYSKVEQGAGVRISSSNIPKVALNHDNIIHVSERTIYFNLPKSA